MKPRDFVLWRNPGIMVSARWGIIDQSALWGMCVYGGHPGTVDRIEDDVAFVLFDGRLWRVPTAVLVVVGP